MDHGIVDSQQHWPNPVNDEDSGQPSTRQDWGFDERDSSYNTYAQTSAFNVFDEILDYTACASAEEPVIEREQGSVASDHDLQQGARVISPPSKKDKHDKAFQDSIQPTSPPAVHYTEGGWGQPAVIVHNHGHGTFKPSPDNDSSKNSRSEPLQVAQLNENMMSLVNGQGDSGRALHKSYVKLEESSPMMSSLLNTPAFQDYQGREYSPPSVRLQSPFQSHNSIPHPLQQPTLLSDQIPRKQRQKWQTELHHSTGEQGWQDSRSNNVSCPNVSRQSPAHQYTLTPTSSSYSNQTMNLSRNPQQSQNYLSPAHISTTTTLYNPSVLFLPGHNRQPNPTSDASTADQIALVRRGQVVRLQKDILNEVKLHIEIMTGYFTHVRKNLSKDVSPAVLQATRHWLESGKVWMKPIPETWKASLPVMPIPIHPVEEMVIQQVHIQRLIETERRQKLGIHRAWPQTPEEWRHDLGIVAHRAELALMRTWTAMFNGMLQDLRSKFPLPEDALEEIRASGGWDQLLGGGDGDDDMEVETEEDS